MQSSSGCEDQFQGIQNGSKESHKVGLAKVDYTCASMNIKDAKHL